MKKTNILFILFLFFCNTYSFGNDNHNRLTSSTTSPNDSLNRWSFGLGATQSFNFPIMHTTPTINIYNHQHTIYFGPEFTLLLKKIIGR